MKTAFRIFGVDFVVEKIVESPDYIPAALKNTHRVTWTFGDRTESFACIDWADTCYDVAVRLTEESKP